MCTAATYKTKDFYFGRTLDYEFSYGDEVVVAPRRFPFHFRYMGMTESHYAIIGMAYVAGGCPLFYDAINEKGLGMAGLNFVGNADYKEPVSGKDNVAQFEFIPWILSQCASVQEARALIERLNITNTPFSAELPVAELHWIIADRDGAITVESMKDGIRIYDNPVGVMTNNPTFDYHMTHLADYMNVSGDPGVNRMMPQAELNQYSRGMGGFGIPGDLSSASRFVKVAFTKMNSVSGSGESESISQFFKILGSVEQQRGCCRLGKDENGNEQCEYTIYSSCCNMDKGIYYYTTYENSQITGVNMHHTDLDGTELTVFDLVKGQQIRMEN